MKESFTLMRGSSVDDRVRRLRGILFVATLTATVLALGGAAAIRIAEPASRTDLPLIFVACVLGALAALAASRERRLRLFRRVLGTVAASLLLTYVLVAAQRPPAIASVSELLADPTPADPAPAAAVAEDSIRYVYRETTGGGLGAKLPAGRGWTTSPPTETTLQAVGDGLYVRVEAIAFLDADEELDDVANRLLAVLAKDSQGVWDGFGSAATFGGRAAVVKEIQVEHEDGSFEERVLVVIEDGDGAAVVVWLGGSYESFESSVLRVVEPSGAWLAPTLASATVNPQRLASLRNADAAERELAAASAPKVRRPYKPRRSGRIGAIQDLADQLNADSEPSGR